MLLAAPGGTALARGGRGRVVLLLVVELVEALQLVGLGQLLGLKLAGGLPLGDVGAGDGLLGDLGVAGGVLGRRRRVARAALRAAGVQGAGRRTACARRCFALLRSRATADQPGSAGFPVRGVPAAPAAVLAQLDAIRVVALALVCLVVAPLALLTREGDSDANVSASHGLPVLQEMVERAPGEEKPRHGREVGRSLARVSLPGGHADARRRGQGRDRPVSRRRPAAVPRRLRGRAARVPRPRRGAAGAAALRARAAGRRRRGGRLRHRGVRLHGRGGAPVRGPRRPTPAGGASSSSRVQCSPGWRASSTSCRRCPG